MIRVMVVDDSPLVRKIASDIVNSASDMSVAATASSAEFALTKLDRDAPDVITMDMEMPGMGGLSAIREIMARRPTPVIVLSAHARRGADLTLAALEAGAVDFVLKPEASLSGGLEAVAEELVHKVRAAASIRFAAPRGRDIETAAQPVLAPRFVVPPHERRSAADGGAGIVAIGTSTGGPVALKTVLQGLPSDFPLPVVVVQHMPPVFTRAFAERLDGCCSVRVKEAEDGDALIPGRVLIAAGNFHMSVNRVASKVVFDQSDLVSGHRPSVDVVMRSVAQEYGPRAIGVIMTGMGRDGASALHELHERGGLVIAQDKDTSVIFGMNREVIHNGDADLVVAVDRIAATLVAHCMGAAVP